MRQCSQSILGAGNLCIGDELCPRPQLNATRAVTVAAGPEDIGPWLVQWGWNRAGFFGSWFLIEEYLMVPR